ncbi:MAG: chain-length determining protein [Brevundimonas sp.]
MTKSSIRYLGPLKPENAEAKRATARRIPIAFLCVVVAPTVIAAIYLLGVASPQYVSEARFVVRSQAREQPSSLGAALQGVGLSAGTGDAFVVHEYLTSRDAVKKLNSEVDLRQALSSASDPFSRIARPWDNSSDEALYENMKRFISVGYDSTTGISTLRVNAFNPADSQNINRLLLDNAEALINRLNERAARDAIRNAEATLQVSQARLQAAQDRITAYRSRERLIDPTRMAQATGELVAELEVELARLRAEREQIAGQASQSPQLPAMDARIAAYERQVAQEHAAMAGRTDSLAPKIAAYENLVLEREFSDRLVATATAALSSAQEDARRQNLYLERIAGPSKPDHPQEPKRWASLLAVLASLLLAYGMGWLIWAGVKESRAHH